LNDNISDKDKQDWHNFVNSKEKLQNKDIDAKYNKPIKTKSIDLHGYAIEEANNIIEKFIYKSYENNVKKLIVITGKGLHSQNKNNPYLSKDFSILKYSVPEFIKNNKELIKIIQELKEAKKEDGGHGAFYIYLKNSNKKKINL
tara:strand:- start:101 stop:532 length:432 start_codon:yes stop_codon:yes gene_type:complete